MKKENRCLFALNSSAVHPKDLPPTPAPVDVATPIHSDGSLGVAGILWYLLLGLIVLTVPVVLFLACGGRKWLHNFIREDGKRKRDGYEKVTVDAEE